MSCDDTDLFERYCLAADFFGAALGKNFEIVVQDVRPGVCRVIHVAGDTSVTGRTVGAPLTDLGMSIVKSDVWKTRPYLCGYAGTTTDGRTLYSSTYFIKSQDELVGMLCVNEDRTDLARLGQALTTLRGTEPSDLFGALSGESRQPSCAEPVPAKAAPAVTSERFYGSPEEIIDEAIRRVRPDQGGQGSDVPLSPDERQAIVAALDEMGLFLMKGTVRLVARRLDCSVPSVYRYLQQVRS